MSRTAALALLLVVLGLFSLLNHFATFVRHAAAAACTALALCSAATPSANVLIVLAGGVDDAGVPHESVMRRLRRAAALYTEERASIVCNGGGTTHKPKWLDSAGYAVPEAALMGKALVAMGVRGSDVYVEGYSDDTIGNAFFLRVMHADVRPEWTRLRVITSGFQIARTRAIYDWVFALLPLPAGKPAYELVYDAVNDDARSPTTCCAAAAAVRMRRCAPSSLVTSCA